MGIQLVIHDSQEVVVVVQKTVLLLGSPFWHDWKESSSCGPVKPITNAHLPWEPQSLRFTYGMSFSLCVTIVPLCNAVTPENKLSCFPWAVCSHAVSLDQLLQGSCPVLLSPGVPCAFRAVTPPRGCPRSGMCLCRPLSFRACRGQAEGHSYGTRSSIPCVGDRNPGELPRAAVSRCPGRPPPGFVRVFTAGRGGGRWRCGAALRSALRRGHSVSAALVSAPEQKREREIVPALWPAGEESCAWSS